MWLLRTTVRLGIVDLTRCVTRVTWRRDGWTARLFTSRPLWPMIRRRARTILPVGAIRRDLLCRSRILASARLMLVLGTVWTVVPLWSTVTLALYTPCRLITWLGGGLLSANGCRTRECHVNTVLWCTGRLVTVCGRLDRSKSLSCVSSLIRRTDPCGTCLLWTCRTALLLMICLVLDRETFFSHVVRGVALCPVFF